MSLRGSPRGMRPGEWPKGAGDLVSLRNIGGNPPWGESCCIIGVWVVLDLASPP